MDQLYRHILGLSFFLGLLSTTEGLRCHYCHHKEGRSSDRIIQRNMDRMEADSDPDCLGRARYAKVVDCNAEPLKDGNDAYRCAKVDIKTTLRQAGKPVTLWVTSRACEQVNTRDLKQEPGCYWAGDYRKEVERSLQAGNGGATVDTVTGRFCLCDGDKCNSVTANIPATLTIILCLSLARMMTSFL